jgi:hypothetical protein
VVLVVEVLVRTRFDVNVEVVVEVVVNVAVGVVESVSTTVLLTNLVTRLVTRLVETNTEVERLEDREAVDPDPAGFPRTITLAVPRITTVPITITLATVEKAIRDRGLKHLH